MEFKDEVLESKEHLNNNGCMILPCFAGSAIQSLGSARYA